MAAVNKIDSNITGLRYAEETALKTVSGSAVWRQMEPNSYSDFGGTTTLVPREPIDPSRQRRKGVIVDLDAAAGLNSDVTLDNLKDLGQGFFFADRRDKEVFDAEGSGIDFSSIAASDDSYNRGSGDMSTGNLEAGSLLFAKDFSDAANNGLKEVVSVAATKIVVAESLVDETPAADTGSLTEVGFEFASGDVDIDDTGTFPQLTSSAKDMTEFGIIPGEFVFIGGDAAAEAFTTSANNGFCRVRSVTANAMTFDKTDGTMVAETGTGKTIRLFFGNVLKNETGTLIKRRSYQMERTLGAPDDASPSQIQSQYLTGSVPNELTITAATASKLEMDMSFACLDDEQRTGATGVKSGTRPTLVSADAINTSSDISKIKLAVVDPTDSNPTALFGFATDVTIAINNGVTADKALGVLGGFDTTSGNFEVSGDIEAFFSNVDAVTAVRANSDVTLEIHYVKSNAGITFDMPLIALGDARLNVEKDEPIKIPLSKDAATGASIDPTLDHTLLMSFWSYLPDLADT